MRSIGRNAISTRKRTEITKEGYLTGLDNLEENRSNHVHVIINVHLQNGENLKLRETSCSSLDIVKFEQV